MLIFAMVAMQRRHQRPGCQWVVNYGEAAAGLRAIDLPMRAKATKLELVASTEWN
jgi:hypothetical protein